MNPSAQAETLLARYHEVLEEYFRWNKRELGSLLENRASRLRFAVFKNFREIAPPAAAIRAEDAALGYRIRRRKDSRTGKAVSVEDEIRLRGKSRVYLAASLRFAVWKTKDSAVERAQKSLSGDGGQTLHVTPLNRGRKHTPMGELVVSAASGQPDPFVSMTSFLDGAVTQNARRRIVAAAFRSETADMLAYIRRKQADALMGALKKIQKPATVVIAA
ncbi:hypothetical protein OpiT1DRAFT_00201 [Opitutaceae bacterium TAV1]|nr:hypothetical protein OpiT1DRAFT_00201 [Opitutaceae bacterium TAV1]